jgi:chlorite dismutase
MPSSAPTPLLVTFSAGTTGPWSVTAIAAVAGAKLDAAARLDVTEAPALAPTDALWSLTGVTSNLRYTKRDEVTALSAKQAGLGRDAARRAVLIPIRKTTAWWALAQDERRTIMEEQSRHIAIGLDYLPAVARRLHHCRDLGGAFDFLTWFEFAPADEAAFDHMLDRLRRSPEWAYVDWEVEVRLSRA